MHVRFLATLLLVFSALTVFAQTNSAIATTAVAVPTLVRFSGTLPASNGNGSVGVTFALYKDQTGGAPLWLETQTVVLDGNGRYSVNLGANHASGIPAELFAAGEARWLGVQAEGQPEQPRVLLVSVPYAMKAADADTLGGLPASAYVTAEQLSVASRQPPAGPTLPNPSSITPQNSATAAEPVTPSPCTAVTSDGTALANYITKFTAPCNIENSGLYQSTAGFLGFGTSAPVAPLDLELPAQTGTTGSIFGEHLIASVNPAANSAANSYAFFGEASTTAGNTFNFTGDLLGSGFIVQHNGTGTVTNGFGGNYSVINHSTGTITNAASFYGLVTNQSTGTITNGYGLEIPPPQNTGGGTFTNFYGVYVSNPTGATNSWGLYTLAAKNYVSGDLGIGTATPTAPLDVVGAGIFTGAVTASSFAGSGASLTALNATNLTTGTVATARGGTGLTSSGTSGEYLRSNGTTWAASAIQKADLPAGTGTITGVTPTTGGGLSGGGTSGAVTLGLTTCTSGQVLASTGTAWACSSSGTGTITKVTAGTDLTGGGSSGAVTLNLDTTKVPTLAATTNTFTGGITASSFSGNGANVTNVTAVNSADLGGVAAADYAQLGTQNEFQATQVINTSNQFYAFSVLNTDSTDSGADGITSTTDGPNGYGVYGAANNGSGAAGIYGTSSSGYGVYGTSTATNGYGVYGEADTGTTAAGVYGTSASMDGYGVYGTSTATNGYGVWGEAIVGVAGVSGTNVGVEGFGAAAGVTGLGKGNNAIGVAGESDNGATAAGVSGTSASGYGVYGTSTASDGYGIYGESDTGATAAGVYGGSASGYGVYGTGEVSGVYGTSSMYGVQGVGSIYGVYGSGGGDGVGVYGEANTGSGPIGVEGFSTGDIGVYGLYNAPSAEGASQRVFYIGVWADTNVDANAQGSGTAFLATADNANAAELYNNSDAFATITAQNAGTAGGGLVIAALGKGGNCTIDVSGELACSGALHSTLPTSDNRTVETYAVQSTENWFEDAGSGQLRNGTASVRLEADFADIVNSGMEYHVFLTPGGNCKGLYVINKTAAGFEVRELGDGQANIAFDYRIMAKRKGKESLRLQDVTARMKTLAESSVRRHEGAAPPLRTAPPTHPHAQPARPVTPVPHVQPVRPITPHPLPARPLRPLPPHHTQPVPPVERPVQKASLVETK